MSTLDIIKYIAFRPRGRKTLLIVSLPVASNVVNNCLSYRYDISNKIYTPTLMREKVRKGAIFKVDCSIITTFGEKYWGYWFWCLEIDRIIVVTSHEKMKYNENFYLQEAHTRNRFELMEIEDERTKR
jgi:hypothetical protein